MTDPYSYEAEDGKGQGDAGGEQGFGVVVCDDPFLQQQMIAKGKYHPIHHTLKNK